MTNDEARRQSQARAWFRDALEEIESEIEDDFHELDPERDLRFPIEGDEDEC